MLRLTLATVPRLLSLRQQSGLKAEPDDLEAGRLAVMASQRRRDEFLAGRWLAKTMLSTVIDQPPSLCRVGGDAGAAPFAVGHRGIHISISHSGDLAACAVSDLPVGVDVEHISRGASAIDSMDWVCHRSEQEQLSGLSQQDRSARFILTWALKEAWLKLHGRGLDFDLMRRLIVDDIDESDANSSSWTFFDQDIVVAVATSDTPSPTVEWLSTDTQPRQTWHHLSVLQA